MINNKINKFLGHEIIQSPAHFEKCRQIVDTIQRNKQTKNEDFSVIFDIGAHAGGYTKALSSSFPNSEVHAFEPMEGIYEALVENVKQFDNVTCHNFGLYDKNIKEICFRTTRKKANAGLFSIYGNQGLTAYGELRKLSDFCIENKIVPTFVKIDTEGCEENILRELTELTDKCLVMIEILRYSKHPRYLTMKDGSEALRKYMRKEKDRLNEICNLGRNDKLFRWERGLDEE